MQYSADRMICFNDTFYSNCFFLKLSHPTCYTNHIAGSPADKADLEVADEILEINGESLANSTHTDVISHIHNVKLA